MRLFSEKVSPTLTDSPLNIIRVQDFQEIFFGVYEVEINKNKYPVEKISEHNGDPVVSIPVEMGGKIANYPFVLTKGKFEVIFNEQSDYVDIFESKIEDFFEEEPDVIEEKVEITIPEVVEDRKNDILLQIQEAKKNALIAAKKELELKKSRQIKQIREESETKKKALESYLESARENLVDEFTIISQRIKKEVFDNNDEKYLEIRETIDNKIEEIRDSLGESLKKDFSKSSQLIDKSIKQLVKDLWEKNINPRVDKELRDIAVEIHEKVSEIDNNLNSKLNKKADRSLLEGVDKEISAIRDANIELNNSLNKGVQKALSRVGNVDKKVIQISEEFERKLEEKEQEVVNYFDEKLSLIKEETLDITDEARKYFQNLIQESRDGLLTEIRKIKNEKPVEYILESKKGEPIIKDWNSIEKDWNKKIHEKFENYKTDLRKYVAVYASGGGTNATQYQDGGTMNGDLTVVGAISANQYLGLSYLLNDYLSLSGGIVTGDVTITGSISASQYLGLSSGPAGPQGPPGDGVAGNNDVGVIYLKNNTIATPISATNARSVVAGTLSSGAMLNFEKDVTTNSLKYTGLSAGRFHVVATFNFYSSPNKTCGFYIGKNTTPSSPLDPNGDRISESEIYADAISQTKPSAAAVQTIVDLNPNDRIFFIVQNKESSEDITVEFLKFVATSLTAEKGDAGPNSVTNITTSNGTASLSVSSLSADRIYTTQLDALSANITVIDIKQYELSGFNVQGDSTVHGSISASGNITADNISVAGNLTVDTDTLVVDSVNNRVGIGTSNPIGSLHTAGSSTTSEFLGLFVQDGITPQNSATGNIVQNKMLSVQGANGAFFHGRDITNSIDFVFGSSILGEAFAGAMSSHNFSLRTNNANRLTVRASSGDVGIGTTSPSARLHTISTTEQVRFGYDVSNYWNATTSSTGVTTLSAAGSGAKFVFANDVEFGANATIPDVVGDTSFADDVEVLGEMTVTGQPVLSALSDNHVMTYGLSNNAYGLEPFSFGRYNNITSNGGSNSFGDMWLQILTGQAGGVSYGGITMFDGIARFALPTVDGHNNINIPFSKRMRLKFATLIQTINGDGVIWFWAGAANSAVVNEEPTTNGYGFQITTSGIRAALKNDGSIQYGDYYAITANLQYTTMVDIYNGTINLYVSSQLRSTVSGGTTTDTSSQAGLQWYAYSATSDGLANNYARCQFKYPSFQITEN